MILMLYKNKEMAFVNIESMNKKYKTKITKLFYYRHIFN